MRQVVRESEHPRVAVLVLNWNGASVIRECLDSLSAMDYPHFSMTVIDNGSSDGSAELIEREYPHVSLVRLPENKLYAGGNNEGIVRAQEEGVWGVLLVNNDTYADPALLRELVAAMVAEPGAAAAGPKIYYYDEKDKIWSAGGRVVFPLGLVHHIGLREKDAGAFDEVREVDYVTGCCILMRAEALRKVGLLDTSYKMYAEDVDWCLRAKRAGWKVLYVSGGRLWHKISHSSGGGLTPYKAYYKLRSNVLLLRKFARPHHWLTWPAATAAYAAAMALAQALMGRTDVASGLVRGWAGGFFARPGWKG